VIVTTIAPVRHVDLINRPPVTDERGPGFYAEAWLVDRFGISPDRASLLASIVGLGPREARHG
jgi:hypothetical protein